MKHKLPNMEHRFKIQLVGEESKVNWVGDFLYRRPTLQERAMIDVMRARLNGDLRSVDPDTNAYNEALSHLRFTLKEYPEWWKECDMGGSLYDANVILEIYGKCMEFEANWREKTFGKPEGVSNELQSPITEAPAAL
jgi:hypothetical protein